MDGGGTRQPGSILVNNTAASTNTAAVTLALSAADLGAAGAQGYLDSIALNP